MKEVSSRTRRWKEVCKLNSGVIQELRENLVVQGDIKREHERVASDVSNTVRSL